MTLVAVPALASLPSPGSNALHLGPFQLRVYGVMIALGVFAAVSVSNRRWVKRGGDQGDIGALALWAVPAGLIGARAYHVATDYQLYQGRWIHAFELWHGGLGIWGGIALGTVVGVIVARRRGLDVPTLMDCAAPALPLAQAIGRIGNWFNQELFGRPSDLPWAVRIDPEHRPERYAHSATFHPTFLYEALWDVAVVGIVLLAERRLHLKPGRLFFVYVAAYTFGRFWIELLRIDPAHHVLGLRINDWVSVIVFVAAAAVVVTGRRSRQSEPEPVPDES